MNNTAVVVGIALSVSGVADVRAQSVDPDSALAALIHLNRYPLRVDRNLAGSGAHFLEARARESDFVLIGEQHGNQETPRVADLLRGQLERVGYDVFAVETGPIVTGAIVERLGRPNGLVALTEFARAYPFGFPFFNWREESEVLQRAVAAGWEVWGLDQEFLGGARYLLDRLLHLAPDQRGRTVVEQWKQRAVQGYEAYQASERTDQSFMMTATPETFAELRAALAGASPEAGWILDEMEESAAVYQLYRSGANYESNHRRIRLLKRHFADSLAAYRARTGRDAKVLLKFGSAHLGRGYSPLNQLDLGNQAAELAYARGRESFHLTVTAGLFERRNGTEVMAKDQSPHLVPLFDALGADDWVVIDLRALRPFLHRRQNRERYEPLAQLVFRYDAVIVTRRLRASSDLIPSGP